MHTVKVINHYYRRTGKEGRKEGRKGYMEEGLYEGRKDHMKEGRKEGLYELYEGRKEG
jgi:hypothetical protein